MSSESLKTRLVMFSWPPVGGASRRPAALEAANQSQSVLVTLFEAAPWVTVLSVHPSVRPSTCRSDRWVSLSLYFHQASRGPGEAAESFSRTHRETRTPTNHTHTNTRWRCCRDRLLCSCKTSSRFLFSAVGR